MHSEAHVLLQCAPSPSQPPAECYGMKEAPCAPLAPQKLPGQQPPGTITMHNEAHVPLHPPPPPPPPLHPLLNVHQRCVLSTPSSSKGIWHCFKTYKSLSTTTICCHIAQQGYCVALLQGHPSISSTARVPHLDIVAIFVDLAHCSPQRHTAMLLNHNLGACGHGHGLGTHPHCCCAPGAACAH
jgi:hypothetical protein